MKVKGKLKLKWAGRGKETMTTLHNKGPRERVGMNWPRQRRQERIQIGVNDVWAYFSFSSWLFFSPLFSSFYWVWGRFLVHLLMIPKVPSYLPALWVWTAVGEVYSSCHLGRPVYLILFSLLDTFFPVLISVLYWVPFSFCGLVQFPYGFLIIPMGGWEVVA